MPEGGIHEVHRAVACGPAGRMRGIAACLRPLAYWERLLAFMVELSTGESIAARATGAGLRLPHTHPLGSLSRRVAQEVPAHNSHCHPEGALRRDAERSKHSRLQKCCGAASRGNKEARTGLFVDFLSVLPVCRQCGDYRRRWCQASQRKRRKDYRITTRQNSAGAPHY